MAMLVITRWYPSFWDTIVPGGFSGALPFLLPRGGWCYSNGPSALNVGHGCIMMYICIYVYIQIRLSISFYIYIILHLYLYLYLYNIDMASRLTAFSIFSYFVDDITSVDSQKFAGLNPRENVPRGSGCWYPCGFVVCVWYCLGAKSCQRRSCQKLGW